MKNVSTTQMDINHSSWSYATLSHQTSYFHCPFVCCLMWWAGIRPQAEDPLADTSRLTRLHGPVCLIGALDWYPPLGSKIPLAYTYRPARIAQSGGPWGPVSRQAGAYWAVSVSIGQWIFSVLHRLFEFSTSSARVGY